MELKVQGMEFGVQGLGFRGLVQDFGAREYSPRTREVSLWALLRAPAMPALHSRYWQRIYTGVEGKVRCGEC